MLATRPQPAARSRGRASLHLRDQHLGLARRAARAARASQIGLAGVPAAEWDAIAALGFDAVWLMGVWERSPAGIAIALAERRARRELPRARCPTSRARTSSARRTASATTRSPAPRRRRRASPSARKALAKRGARADPRLRARTTSRPTIRGRRRTPSTSSSGERRRPRARPGLVRPVGDRVLANGRDPFFPAWPDVVQLNAFSPDLRARRDRHARLDRRPVRRRPLRHGDADDERRLRAHLGRARRRAARDRLLADRDRRDQGARTPTSSSWPRPTGTSSTRSSSRASTTATTSASTTGSSTRAPSRCAAT